MSQSAGILELRLSRWLVTFLAIAVPGTIVILFVLSVWVLFEPPGREQKDLVIIVSAWLILGGLIVAPGISLLRRHGRGIPVTRMDDRGIVWGRDRDRDLSVNWEHIEVVSAIAVGGTTPERAFRLQLRKGHVGSSPKGAYGRYLVLTNTLRYGTRYVISTYGLDHSSEDVRRYLGDRLPPEVFAGEGRQSASR